MSGGDQQGKILLGIYGTGGHAREVLPVANAMLRAEREPGSYELVFIDDERSADKVNGRRVLTFDEFLDAEATSRAVSIAIADWKVRRKLDNRCRGHGVGFFSILSPNALLLDDVSIAEGAILSPFVTITSNVRIGRHFHANLYCSVSHDCRIGDYVTFAPRASCNGNTIVEDHAYLGSGCRLRHGTPGAPLVIGEGAVVGMGAIVTKNVPPGVTVVGNPAKPLHGT